MRIEFTLGDDVFDESKRDRMREALGLEGDEEFVDAMNRLCKAATLEYIAMLSEGGMPRRADEVREDRAYLLVKHYYQTRLPSESEIASIFQLTASQSRTLLRNVRSRYRYSIGRDILSASAKEIVERAEENSGTGRWDLRIGSRIVLEELNLLLAKEAPMLKPIRLQRNSSAIYEVEQDTYNWLRVWYDLD